MKKKIFYLILLVSIIILFKDNVYAYNTYHAGEKIRFRNYDYYVLEESDESSDYIYLLKATPLNSTEMYKYSQDENHNFIYDELLNNMKNNVYLIGIPYYKSSSCFNNYDTGQKETSGCKNNYEDSFVKILIDNWKENSFGEDELKTVNGYSAKLLSFDEIVNLLHYEEVTYAIFSDYFYTEDTLNIIPEELIDKLSNAFTMTPEGDSYVDLFGPNITSTFIDDPNIIVPTIYLKKCVLENTCTNKLYDKYTYGDKVTLRGENYYVIEDSNESLDYVTVIKEKPLKMIDIKKYDKLVSGQNNKIFYDYKDNELFHDYIARYTFQYENSAVKTLIDGWANGNFYTGELKRVNGFKARLLNDEDIIIQTNEYPSNITNLINNNPDIIKGIFDDEDEYYEFINNTHTVNPVVNLKKCALNGTCSTTEKEEYHVGDEVTFKGQKFHVLADSDKYTNYVTLLKDESLTNEELNEYLNDEYSSDVIYEDRVKFNIKKDGKFSNIYQGSIVETIVNNWANKTFENNLVYKDKYASRLLTMDDLTENLGYEWGGDTAGTSTSYGYFKTEHTPSWFNTNELLYSMTPYNDSSDTLWGIKSDKTEDKYVGITTAQVRPVVNVNKCLLNPNSDNCQKCTRVTKENTEITLYKQYDIGDIVTYKDNEYYVYEQSDKNKSYLKLLKKEPLTANEINTYGKDDNGNSVVNRNTFYVNKLTTNNIKSGIFALFNPSVENDNVGLCSSESDLNCGITTIDNNKNYLYYYSFNTVIPGSSYEDDNGYGGMLYYTDETCHLVNNSKRMRYEDETCLKYHNNYTLSNVKVVVDNWANDKLDVNDLVDINGYTWRLLNYGELQKAVNQDNVKSDYLKPNNYEYWLIDSKIDTYNTTEASVITIYGIKKKAYNDFNLIYPAVRPVIFLKKSVIPGGVITQKISTTRCKTPEDDIIVEPEPEPEPVEPTPTEPTPKPTPEPTPTIIPDYSDPDQPIIPEDIEPEDIEPIDNKTIIIEKKDGDIIDAPNTMKVISIVSIIGSIALIGTGAYVLMNIILKSKKQRKF